MRVMLVYDENGWHAVVIPGPFRQGSDLHKTTTYHNKSEALCDALLWIERMFPAVPFPAIVGW